MAKDRIRYESLDGLRGLAAYTVVLTHFSNNTNIWGGVLGYGAGQLGVMLFFCLSGFLMARLYMDQPLTCGAVLDFFRRRIARVVPLYVALVLASHLLQQWRGNAWPLYNLSDVANTNVWTHLLFIKGTSVFWTIPVEVQFYAVFPVIWLLYRWQGWTAALWLLLTIVVIAASGFNRFIELAPYAAFFIAGCIAAMLPKPPTAKGMNALFVLCCVLYVATFPRVAPLFRINTAGMWVSPLYMLLIPVFLLASLHAPLAKIVLGNPVARFLGNISYSVYLLHLPVMLVMNSKSPAMTNLILYLLLTTLVSWISFIILEVPLRAWIAEGKNPVALLREAFGMKDSAVNATSEKRLTADDGLASTTPL